jgi:PKD repeat protein
MDDIRIYNRALSDSEIQQLYVGETISDNSPPVPIFTLTPAQGTPPLTVIADGRGSYDKEGIITHSAWRTSDSQTAATPKTSFTFTKPGNYQITLTVTDEKNLSASKTQTVKVIPPTAHLINISTRAKIMGGVNNIVAGFVIRGTGTVQVMIRGFGLENSVNPYLKLQEYPSGKVLAGNNDWQKDPYWREIPATMKLPKVTDAGLIRTLPVGAYTVTLSSLASQGLGLIGINAIESTTTPKAKLENISTRASIQGEGAYDIIAGFIITGTGNQKVFIRGLGLAEGVDSYLKLEKYPSGDFVAHNNNWLVRNPRATEIPAHMQGRLKSTDAAIVVDLPAGAYTATLMSVDKKGLGLIGVDAIE